MASSAGRQTERSAKLREMMSRLSASSAATLVR
jgi:hypothetical protein